MFNYLFYLFMLFITYNCTLLHEKLTHTRTSLNAAYDYGAF